MREIRFLLLAGLVAVLLLAGGAFAAPSGVMSLETVEGLIHGDTVASGQNLRFVIRMNNDLPVNVNIEVGWRVISPDGALFDSIRIDSCGPFVATKSKLKQYFDLTCRYLNFKLGPANGPDTVGFLGAVSDPTAGLGLPAGYNDTTFAVKVYMDTTTKVPNHGKHICIDSSFYPPGGTWVWYDPGPLTPYIPTWVGMSGEAPADTTGFCFVLYNSASAVNERDNGLPHSFAVSQNYPNPFNPTTKINFDVPVKSEVRLTIYNVLGQKVSTLINKSMQPGKYQVDWSGQNDGGSQVASGVYFYKFEAGSFVQTKKMVMLK